MIWPWVAAGSNLFHGREGRGTPLQCSATQAPPPFGTVAGPVTGEGRHDTKTLGDYMRPRLCS